MIDRFGFEFLVNCFLNLRRIWDRQCVLQVFSVFSRDRCAAFKGRRSFGESRTKRQQEQQQVPLTTIRANGKKTDAVSSKIVVRSKLVARYEGQTQACHMPHATQRHFGIYHIICNVFFSASPANSAREKAVKSVPCAVSCFSSFVLPLFHPPRLL